MGRGRAKAKQTKIARQLKYADHGSDLARLQSELGTAAAGKHDGADREGLDDPSSEGQQRS
ncbi:DUF3073 domain-containing protein [Catenulispora rubra]|uniref:DUF3073 domain-containing protein n=1 Tax=Catenulispora rubra TaxID=280293 RepID=UPI001892495A|nr:DUF3073 domain-containing protein [Catenulispora rubra]